MKVSRLIALLANLDSEDTVLAFDADLQRHVPVTGLVFGGTDGQVKMYTDCDGPEFEIDLTEYVDDEIAFG